MSMPKDPKCRTSFCPSLQCQILRKCSLPKYCGNSDRSEENSFKLRHTVCDVFRSRSALKGQESVQSCGIHREIRLHYVTQTTWAISHELCIDNLFPTAIPPPIDGFLFLFKYNRQQVVYRQLRISLLQKILQNAICSQHRVHINYLNIIFYKQLPQATSVMCASHFVATSCMARNHNCLTIFGECQMFDF